MSFANPEQITIAADVCQSFALDNGAFSVWTKGQALDIEGYIAWINEWKKHPGFDWCLIPDVIDGDEAANDELLDQWPIEAIASVPVWHLHESIERLARLCNAWPRIAIGSSGNWPTPGTQSWWGRIAEAMNAICDAEGRPPCKLHGLRMLDPEIFRYLPFASADSTNVARNIGIDAKWNGTYQPPSKEIRAVVLAERIEQFQSAPAWKWAPVQEAMFA